MSVDFSAIPSPCYVLDEALLIRNLEKIIQVRDKSNIEIILAFKGFAMWSVFPLIQKYGFTSATASSLNEALLAFEEMGALAHTYCPAYHPDEFDKIAQVSSHITFNSLKQYENYIDRLKAIDDKISVGLRVNHEFSEVQTALYNPCAPGSRLGILASELGNQLPKQVDGLHFHSLCESKSYDLEKALNAFTDKFGHLLDQIKWVNMGGGHLITHKDYDVEHLVSVLQNFKVRYPHIHVILEPGAAFAWETGYLVSTVLDIVENKGIKTAMLDVSFTAHMPDCLEMPYQPIILGANQGNDGPFVYRMGGNSCLSGDFMGNWSFNEELQLGQRVVFNDMIHYTMVKTSLFNGLKHPSIGICNDTGFKLIKQFSYSDYKNKLS